MAIFSFLSGVFGGAKKQVVPNPTADTNREIPAERAPITVAQALLLYSAWCYYGERLSRGWQADFFHTLALVIDDLRGARGASATLAGELAAYFEDSSNGRSIPSIYRWLKESDRKVKEEWIDDCPPYRFNGTGVAIAERIDQQAWDDHFEPQVARLFTPAVTAAIRVSMSEYQKLKIDELHVKWVERFHPDRQLPEWAPKVAFATREGDHE